MPGLYSFRPGLGSASKSGKVAVTANAIMVLGGGGSEHKAVARDDKGAAVMVQQQGRSHLPNPEQHQQAPARRGLLALQFHHAEHVSNGPVRTRPPPRANGVDILKRMSNADYSSSGSAHEINSVCLAEMVHEFLEEEADCGPCGRARCNCKSGTCGGDLSLLSTDDEEDGASSQGGEHQVVQLQGLISCVGDFETTILAAVTATVKALSDEADLQIGDKSSYRVVMSRLRAAGHNAAICKSRWEHTGGIPGGEYEYLDVLAEALGAKAERLIVDLDFRTQFEIARPSFQYKALLDAVPSIFVGKADRLLQIVNLLCEATKRSVKKKGMPLPPWRKAEYIKAKWLSTYKRTTNSSSGSTSSRGRDGAVGAGAILSVTCWDPKVNTEMEANYTSRVVAEKRKVLRDSNGLKGGAGGIQQLFKKQELMLEPEGVVRGARLMMELARSNATRSEAMAASQSQQGDWVPPAVESSLRSGKAARKGTSMLASIIAEGAITHLDRTRVAAFA